MKKLFLFSSLPILVFVVVTSFASAQAITSDQIKAQMVSDWQRAKAYTIEYLNTMPADKYSFQPVDSIKRSFAQQMLHLAGGNILLMSKATDAKPPLFFGYDLEHGAGAQSKDSVMYYVTSSYDYCINAVQSSDVNKWGEMTDIFGMKLTRYALMTKAFEHQTHHRGQTTIYIRLQSIRPPQEKLF